MSEKRGVVFGLIILFSLAYVSAGFFDGTWSTITGRAIGPGGCTDYDGAQNFLEASRVKFSGSTYWDYCLDLNNDSIYETAVDYYCISNRPEIDVDVATPTINANVVSSGDWSLGIAKRNCQTSYGVGCISGKCVCYEGEVKTCGYSNIGVCILGMQTCMNETWSSCVGAVYPTAEVCYDALDNDCDGYIDEGCSNQTNYFDLEMAFLNIIPPSPSIGEEAIIMKGVKNSGNIPGYILGSYGSDFPPSGLSASSSSSGSSGGTYILPGEIKYYNQSGVYYESGLWTIIRGYYGIGQNNISDINLSNNEMNLSFMVQESSTTLPELCEEIYLNTASSKLFIGDPINKYRSILTDTEIPNLLEDGTFMGNVVAEYTQYIQVTNNSFIDQGNHPTHDDPLVIAIDLPENPATPFYSYRVTFDQAVNFADPNSKLEWIDLMGRRFIVGAETTNTSLYLYPAGGILDLSIGGTDPQSESVIVRGNPYLVELVSASDTSVTVKVTDQYGVSETKVVLEGTSKEISGLVVSVNLADENPSGLYAQLLISYDKIKLTSGMKVKVGADEVSVDGTIVSINGYWSNVYWFTISYVAADTDVDAILVGDYWVDPVVDNLKVEFESYDATNGARIKFGGCADGESASECTDSDGGLNGDVFGVVTYNGYSVSDSCQDDDTVSEAICNQNGVLEWWPVECAFACEGGACVNGTSNQTNNCDDTDGGIVFDVKGVTSGLLNGVFYGYEDFCYGGSSLMEYYCEGVSPSYTVTNCSESCSDGACLGCQPRTCADLVYECGSYDDGCGGMINCGACGANETCVIGQCISVEPCDLVDAFWTQTNVMAGTNVDMVIIGNGSCDGHALGITIYEDDLFGDDFMGNPNTPLPVIFNGNFATAIWTAEWTSDGWIGDPEYFFEVVDASAGIDPLSVIRSNNLLTVYPNPNETYSVCGNYLIEEGEQCDTNLWLNGKYCIDFGYSGGILGCSEDNCQYDFSQCTRTYFPQNITYQVEPARAENASYLFNHFPTETLDAYTYLMKGMEKNGAYGNGLIQLNLLNGQITNLNYGYNFANNYASNWYYNKYGFFAQPDFLGIVLSDFGPNETYNKEIDLGYNFPWGYSPIYLPALNSCEDHWREFYVSLDGSTYYARADHGCGYPDLSPEEALVPEHLARAKPVSCYDSDGGRIYDIFGVMRDWDGYYHHDKCVTPVNGSSGWYVEENYTYYDYNDWNNDSCFGTNCYIAEADCAAYVAGHSSGFWVEPCTQGCYMGACLSSGSSSGGGSVSGSIISEDVYTGTTSLRKVSSFVANNVV